MPPLVLFEKLQIKSLMPVIRRSLVAFAGITFMWTSAFVRNSDKVTELAREIGSWRDVLGRLPRWFYQFLLGLVLERNPENFVENAIEAFRCKRWLESNGTVSEPNIDHWIPPCLLARFFVQLMSDYAPADHWDQEQITRKSVLHQLEPGAMSMSDLAMFAPTADILLVHIRALHEFGNPVLVRSERKYRLKAEFDDLVSPFWLLYLFPQFVSQASVFINDNPLIPIPKTDERNGKFVHRFASSSPFIDFIAKSVQIAGSHEEYGPVLLHCLLELVNMTTEARYETIELLHHANVFNSFAAVSSLRIPLMSLLSRIPSVAAVVRIPESPPRARRPDKSQILQQFADQRERFESMQEFDAEPDEGMIVYVACHEPIDLQRQLFGFLWTGRSLQFCGHVVHLTCCSSQMCPVCRISANLFTPILLPGFTERQRRAMSPTIDFLSRNDFAAVVERVGQLLDVEMPLLDKFVPLMQSVIFGLDGFDPGQIADQPLLFLASLLPLASTQDHFEWVTTNLWKSEPCPFKSAAMLWNCTVQFRQTDL
jgi:hypothetical protein